MDEIRNMLLGQEITLPYFYDHLNDPYAQAVLKLTEKGDLKTNRLKNNSFQNDFIEKIWTDNKDIIKSLQNGQFVEIQLENEENRKKRRQQLYIYYLNIEKLHYYVLSHFYFPKLIENIKNSNNEILDLINIDISGSLDMDSTYDEILVMEEIFSKHLNLIQYLLLEKLPFSIKCDKLDHKFSRIAISLRTLVYPIYVDYNVEIGNKIKINLKRKKEHLIFKIENKILELNGDTGMEENYLQEYFSDQQEQKDRELLIYWYLKTKNNSWNEKDKKIWLEQHSNMEELYDQFCYEIKAYIAMQKELKERYNRARERSKMNNEKRDKYANKELVLPDLFR